MYICPRDTYSAKDVIMLLLDLCNLKANIIQTDFPLSTIFRYDPTRHCEFISSCLHGCDYNFRLPAHRCCMMPTAWMAKKPALTMELTRVNLLCVRKAANTVNGTKMTKSITFLVADDDDEAALYVHLRNSTWSGSTRAYDAIWLKIENSPLKLNSNPP